MLYLILRAGQNHYISRLSQRCINTSSSEETEIAYHKLARRDRLQLHSNINTQMFAVELVDENGSVINRKLLSAGEKKSMRSPFLKL